MKPGMKMALMNNRRGGRMESRNDMDNAGMNYGMDNEADGMENEMEMRRRYRRDSRGRFRAGMEMGGYGRSERDEMEGGYSNYEARMGGYPGRPFPVYEDGRSNMNQIGFNADRNEIRTNGRMDATYGARNEMEHKTGHKMGGGAMSSVTMPMTRETAEHWIHHMKNADGTKGPHWTMEEAKKLMEQKKLRCDPYEFAAILNAMYSDYCGVMRKHGVESDDLYADLAAAWLMDDDAMPNKAMLYYECIVEK